MRFFNNSSNIKSSIKFKESEIELVNTSWETIKNAGFYECGVGLMTRILIEHRDLKYMWRKIIPANDELTDDEVIKTPMQLMKDHGIKVFEGVQIAVNSLNDFQSVAATFNELGYKHYKFGARSEHIEVVKF